MNIFRVILIYIPVRSVGGAEIAQECGFYDQSHFIRTFKRIRRQTPAQYRRAHFSA